MNEGVSHYESLGPMANVFAGGVPVLLYHKIDFMKPRVIRRGLYISPRIFRAQLLELRRAGFASAAVADVMDGSSCGRIVVSFDDGFRNVLERALEILKDCGFSAINFLVSSRIGEINHWDLVEGERPESLMDENDVGSWILAGNKIGAHTRTHPYLTRLPLEAARQEIDGSKKALEDQFGVAVTDFAYPYGDVNRAVRDLVEEAGFQRAWTTQPAVVRSDLDPFLLPRFPVMVSLRKPMNLLRSLV